MGKKIGLWFKGERIWVRYIILFLIVFLLWQGYQNRDNIFDGAIEFYDEINITEILPLEISDEIPEDSLFNKKSVSSYNR